MAPQLMALTVRIPMTRIPLPPELIPFILNNLEGFDATLEDGERIVLSPKEGVVAKPGPVLPALVRKLPVVRPMVRPKFTYTAVDRRLTLEQAKKYLSEHRYLVYTAIFTSGKTGVQAKEIMEQTGLPHGSVQQILNWLRRQKMVRGEPDAS